MSALVKNEFFAWVDAALGRPIPTETVAFHFNLYEGTDSVHVQLMGTDSFEGGEEYWPGRETFTTGEDIFEVPFESAGAEWPQWLESLKILVRAYIDSGSRSAVLRNSRGVGIGFVDGDMYVLWPRRAA
jgi:hypothetical protein